MVIFQGFEARGFLHFRKFLRLGDIRKPSIYFLGLSRVGGFLNYFYGRDYVEVNSKLYG